MGRQMIPLALLLTTWILFWQAKVLAGTTRHNFDRFFCSVDRDGDGEIEQHEATKFLSEMGVSETAKHPHLEEFSYGGKTISSDEMIDHLQNMLTADMVVNWITHGLQLPQYSEAFQRNAVNGLDFLSLIENGSWALSEELGVSSSLHKTKITGAIVRQVFGYGAPPGFPRKLLCQPSTCGGIQLNWEPPSTPGYPPLHKYLVYRWSGATSAWILVADTKETSYFDNDELFIGKDYAYRVQAWGGHGPSEWVTVTNCTASARSFLFQGVVTRNAGVVEELKVGGETEVTKEMDITPWGWIFSVNGGLFLLGILSRQSFFFRVTLAAWVVLRDIVKRVTVRIYETQASENVWLRTLARGFVSLCCGWMFIQRKILLLSRQACTKPSVCVAEEKVLSHSDSFRHAIGYSTPDCTIEEMVAAIQNARFDESQKLDIARTFVTMASTLTHEQDERSKSFPDSSLDEVVSDSSTSPLESRSLSSPVTFTSSQQELSMNRKRTRHRCNYEGCKNRFDRWYYVTDWRMRFSKHYCRECQRVFCVKHTRISPHGPVGRCGLDSTCVCLACFNALSQEVQERLERINKLRVGPPVMTAGDSSHGLNGESDRDPFPPDFSTLTKSLNSSSTGSL